MIVRDKERIGEQREQICEWTESTIRLFRVLLCSFLSSQNFVRRIFRYVLVVYGTSRDLATQENWCRWLGYEPEIGISQRRAAQLENEYLKTCNKSGVEEYTCR